MTFTYNWAYIVIAVGLRLLMSGQTELLSGELGEFCRFTSKLTLVGYRASATTRICVMLLIIWRIYFAFYQSLY